MNSLRLLLSVVAVLALLTIGAFAADNASPAATSDKAPAATDKPAVTDAGKTPPAPAAEAPKPMSGTPEAHDTYEYQIYIDAPVEKVWDALINPATVKKYYMGLELTIEPKVGGKMDYGAKGKIMLTGQIKKIQPNKLLEQSFAFMELTGEPGQMTTVKYILKPDEKVTWLIVQQIGYPDDSQHYTDISGGWPTIISGLKTLLETGHVLGEKPANAGVEKKP